MEVSGPPQDHLVLVQIDGLEVIVEGAELHRLQRVLPIAVPGDDHHLREGSEMEHFVQRLEPLLRPIGVRGEAEVQAHELRLDLLKGGKRLSAIFREGQGVLVA